MTQFGLHKRYINTLQYKQAKDNNVKDDINSKNKML